MLRREFLAILVMLLFLAPPTAQGSADLLRETADKLATGFVAEPPELSGLFTARFLESVSWPAMRKLLAKTHSENGPLLRVEEDQKVSALSGKFRFVFENRKAMPVSLELAGAPPQIAGLWFGPAVPLEDSLDRIVGELRSLPGRTSLCVMELGERPRTVVEHEAGKALAIGSAFKLFILGALVEAVGLGHLRWDQTVALRDDWTSLPSGVLQDWPVGTPVTLATLAGEMISISDNTATDHLLFHLGRERVERMLVPMGVEKPAGMIPCLSTQEMFQLKRLGGEKQSRAYARAKAEGRRALLERLDRVPRRDVSLDESPRFVDRIEWFASTSDLCRAVDWLRRRTDAGAPALARKLLAIRPGLPCDKEAWRYVGYKGGSEAGVLSLTWLLERADRRWFAVSASWNDAGKVLEDGKLAVLMTRTLAVLAAWDRAPYYRVFRGRRRADVPAGEFNRAIPEKFVPALPRALAGKGLIAYVPALPATQAATGTPDEFAIVAYESEAVYRRLGTLPEGKAYQALHWDYFDRGLTKTGGAVPFLGTLEAETPVDVLNRPVDWQSGQCAVFIGERLPAIPRWRFLRQLSTHLGFVKKSFAGRGLDGYLVAANEDRELAWLHWTSAEAMRAAMATPEGARVLADAGRLMRTAMWAEAGPFQGTLVPGQAVNVRFSTRTR